MTMQLAKIRHLSVIRARSILTAIQAGEQSAQTPAAVSINERNTAEDEINSFLADIRAASGVMDDLHETALLFVAYQAAPAALRIEELDVIRDLYRFLSGSDVERLIEAAIDDLETAADNETLDIFFFDGLKDEISSLVDSYIEALDIKKYFDEDGAASGAYVLIECGGPTLYFHWLDSAGAYITATGRTTGGSATRDITGEDLEIINQLYFFGELSI